MINIIGAGMAGSILAKLLRKEGIEFRIFDAEKKYRSSVISENLIGTTWYDKQRRDLALNILESIVPVRFLNTGSLKAHHVYVSDLLESNYMVGTVKPQEHGALLGSTLYNGLNIICTGAWANEFVPCKAMAGHGFIFDGKQEEFIKGWKPYRHLKFIEYEKDKMWFGNTVVVGQGNYWADRPRYEKELYQVANEYLGPVGPRQIHVGYRPKTEEQRVFKVKEGYVITGGYKSGMADYPRMCQNMVSILQTHETKHI